MALIGNFHLIIFSVYCRCPMVLRTLFFPWLHPNEFLLLRPPIRQKHTHFVKNYLTFSYCLYFLSVTTFLQFYIKYINVWKNVFLFFITVSFLEVSFLILKAADFNRSDVVHLFHSCQFRSQDILLLPTELFPIIFHWFMSCRISFLPTNLSYEPCPMFAYIYYLGVIFCLLISLITLNVIGSYTWCDLDKIECSTIAL